MREKRDGGGRRRRGKKRGEEEEGCKEAERGRDREKQMERVRW